MNQQKKIIIFITGLFILSSVVLFSFNDYYLNSEFKKDYWAVYFNNPKSTSMDFAIENHSSQENFNWQIYVGDKMTREGKSQVAKGEIKNIVIHLENYGIKMTVVVMAGNEKKEIYKNF